MKRPAWKLWDPVPNWLSGTLIVLALVAIPGWLGMFLDSLERLP